VHTDAVQGGILKRLALPVPVDINPLRSTKRLGSPHLVLHHSSVFKAQPVVHRMTQFLFAPQVTFSGLNRSVSEQELDLLQFAAGQVAQTRTGTPQIMRREVLDAGTLGSGLHHVPNRFWRDPFTPNMAEPVNTTEDPASVNAGSLKPPIDSSLRPDRHWNCADMSSLADEIRYNPMFLSNLQVIGPQADEFRPTKSAPNQQRQDGTVTLAPCRLQGQRFSSTGSLNS
jgi:hypothetical protein